MDGNIVNFSLDKVPKLVYNTPNEKQKNIMNISELIKNLKEARAEHGELKVCIVGQDGGGVYPNNYVSKPIGVWLEESENILIVDIDGERFTEEADTISEVINTLNTAMTEYGDLRVEIELQDDGGDYDEHGSWGVDVYFEQKFGEEFYSIG